MKLRPTIGAQQPTFQALQACKGRTIGEIEYGFVPDHEDAEDAHTTEKIILNFTDGTSLELITGSNAYNLASKHGGFKAKDVHVDLVARHVGGSD